MRAMTLAFVLGLALAASAAQAAPVVHQPAAIDLRAATPFELVAQGSDGAGIALIGEIGEATGTGADPSRIGAEPPQ